MSTSVAGKTLKDFFSKTSVEKLSQNFGDPNWLREKRLAGWAAYERDAANPQASGSRFLSRMKDAHAMLIEPGSKAAIPQTLRPALTSEWGALAGCSSYGCEENSDVLLAPEAANQGVLFMPLAQAIRKHEGLMREHLFSRTAVDETSYAALHAAYFGQGSFVYVPKGVRLERPLKNIGVHTGGHAGFFPHTLIVLEEGAELTFIDEVHSAGPQPGFCSQVSELILGNAAKLSYVHFQNLNSASGCSLRQRTYLNQDAYLYTLGMIYGSSFSSSYLETRLDGEGAQVDLLGLVLGKKDQMIEIRTLQDHNARAGMSDALVKSILRDKANFYFDGVVKIHKQGQNSNAFQSNPNLLLSSDCKAESIPTLEIEADDVACKHAASIGSIDEEERFYLLSRGISEKETESIIVEGFAAELAQRLPNENLQESFIEILNRLSREQPSN